MKKISITEENGRRSTNAVDSEIELLLRLCGTLLLLNLDESGVRLISGFLVAKDLEQIPAELL